jgi:flavorubredoxin
MRRVLIAYDSRTGHTEKMSEYVAEGIRMGGNQAELKKIHSIKHEKDLEGYDAYVLGCPTYHRDMTGGMKTFLFLMEKAKLEGKVGGAFGSYTHSGDAPSIIFDTMEYVFKMKMTKLGSFNLKEALVDKMEGARACQEYGKGIIARLEE